MISTAQELRALIRQGDWTGQTAGELPGIQQANFVALPAADAYDVLLYCVRNPKVCPILDVTDPGDPHLELPSGTVDLRTDIPRYRVWRDGELSGEPTDITERWTEDLVGFLLGCSHTFEGPLLEAGYPVHRVPGSPGPAVYITNRETTPAGRVAGPLVVSMRTFRPDDVESVTRLTSRYPTGHGAPVHIGDPSALGIADLSRPDFGPPREIPRDEVPMFWACGVTPQLVLPGLRSHTLITHAAGHMFVYDHEVEPVSGF